MKKLEEIETILNLHKKEIKEKYHIKQIAIFGSVARNEETGQSDVDILVELDQNLRSYFLF